MTEEIERTEENHVIWRNSQWVITEDGFLSARHMSYHIRVAHLAQGVTPRVSWHSHLALKSWVDLQQFNQACVEALRRFAIPHDPDEINRWEDEAFDLREGVDLIPRYDHGDDAYYGHWA